MQKPSGWPSVSEENVDRVRASRLQSPKKSLRRRSLQLGIPKSTLHKVVRKRLRLTPYKTVLLHEIKPIDRNKRLQFAVTMLQKFKKIMTFLKIYFLLMKRLFTLVVM